MLRPRLLLFVASALVLLLLSVDPVVSNKNDGMGNARSHSIKLPKDPAPLDSKKSTKDIKGTKAKSAKAARAVKMADSCTVHGITIDGYGLFPKLNPKPAADVALDAPIKFKTFFVQCGIQEPECYSLDGKTKAKLIKCNDKGVAESMKAADKLKKSKTPVRPPSISKDDPPI